MNRKILSLNIVGSMLLILVTACSGPDIQTLQPLPELDLEDMSDAVREQIADGIAGLQEDERDPEANGRLGMLFDAYARTKVASALYARARFLDPDSFQWTYLHGLTLKKLGNSDAAIEALERALVLRVGYPSAQLELAGLVYTAGGVERSTQLYTQLIDRNPSYARAHFEYGKLLFEQGETQTAIVSLKSALGLSNRFGQVHYTLSQAYRKLGDQQQADLHLALFERYRKFGPGANDPLRSKISALNISDFNKLERALVLSVRGKNETAAEMLEELALTSDSAVSHINLIAVYGELGEYAKAQEHADIAMSIDPESLELHDNIGVLLLRQARYDEAMTVFRAAIDIDPEYSVPHRNLGAVLEASRDLEQAIASYRRAVALDPYDRQAVHFLARALLNDNQPEEAIVVIKGITLHAHPEVPIYLQLLGRAYQRAGDYENAADAFRRAIVAAQMRGRQDIVREATDQLDRVHRLLQR